MEHLDSRFRGNDGFGVVGEVRDRQTLQTRSSRHSGQAKREPESSRLESARIWILAGWENQVLIVHFLNRTPSA